MCARSMTLLDIFGMNRPLDPKAIEKVQVCSVERKAHKELKRNGVKDATI